MKGFDFMLKKVLLLAICTLIALPAVCQTATKNTFDGKTWWEHVKVLADDKMEGRDTGSEGLRKAEAYVVEQLKQLGLEPAGKDGYYQAVQLSVPPDYREGVQRRAGPWRQGRTAHLGR